MGKVAKTCMIGFSAALLMNSLYFVAGFSDGTFDNAGFFYILLLKVLFPFFLVIFCYQFSKVVSK